MSNWNLGVLLALILSTQQSQEGNTWFAIAYLLLGLLFVFCGWDEGRKEHDA